MQKSTKIVVGVLAVLLIGFFAFYFSGGSSFQGRLDKNLGTKGTRETAKEENKKSEEERRKAAAEEEAKEPYFDLQILPPDDGDAISLSDDNTKVILRFKVVNVGTKTLEVNGMNGFYFNLFINPSFMPSGNETVGGSKSIWLTIEEDLPVGSEMTLMYEYPVTENFYDTYEGFKWSLKNGTNTMTLYANAYFEAWDSGFVDTNITNNFFIADVPFTKSDLDKSIFPGELSEAKKKAEEAAAAEEAKKKAEEAAAAEEAKEPHFDLQILPPDDGNTLSLSDDGGFLIFRFKVVNVGDVALDKKKNGYMYANVYLNGGLGVYVGYSNYKNIIYVGEDLPVGSEMNVEKKFPLSANFFINYPEFNYLADEANKAAFLVGDCTADGGLDGGCSKGHKDINMDNNKFIIDFPFTKSELQEIINQ